MKRKQFFSKLALCSILAVTAAVSNTEVMAVIILDTFSTVSYSNNDGDQNWASDWVEIDGNGIGPSSGNVFITGGELSLDDQPNTGGEPSTGREADLSSWSVAFFEFDWRTTSGVDSSDSIIVEISADGGASYTTLEDFTGISGTSNGQRAFDVTSFISNQTTVRFRVANLYGGQNENFLVDNVQLTDQRNVPEPTTFLLMGLGLAGLGFARRRRLNV